ncbi:MAG: DUF4157 domain-containing protein [Myxococcota bacterium]
MQLRAATPTPSGRDVHAVAQSGVQGSGGALPFLDTIQMSFGRHDVSNVQFYSGGVAVNAARELGAHGYTVHNKVVAPANDLHTVAHEAAHVIQQRAGVQLKGGVGEIGDRYERHADDVANLVVRGQSAEQLLDRYAPSVGSGAAPPVQRQAVQFRRYTSQNAVRSVTLVQEVAAGDNIHAMRALLRAMDQAAERRVSSGGEEVIQAHGGGDHFDLTMQANDVDIMRRSLRRRIRHVRAAARAEAEAGAFRGGDPFAQSFNHIFAGILPALRQADRTESGDQRQPEITPQELRTWFTSEQRRKLTRYFSTRIIPDHLFTSGNVGGCNAQQRILIAGEILTNGEYRPESWSQRLHARMCGHWVRLVHTYAGATTERGNGVNHQLDHQGNVTTGGGSEHVEYHGDRQTLASEEQVGRRRFTMAAMPVEQFDSIEPGDWLYIHTGANTAGGNHSVVFSHWAGPLNADHQPPYRTAIIYSQWHPDEGGQRTETHLGAARGLVRGSPIYTVTRDSRVERDAQPSQTPDDVIEHDLGINADGTTAGRQTRARGAVIPELGNGAIGQANTRLVGRMERRLEGGLDLNNLRSHLRSLNTTLITQLAQHGTDTQRELFEQTNARDDIPTLIRLNERLNLLSTNTARHDEAAQRHAHGTEERPGGVVEQHEAAAEELQRLRSELGGIIRSLDEEIDRAEHVRSLELAIRNMGRERRLLQRNRRYYGPLVERNRDREPRPRNFDRWNEHYTFAVTRLREIETELPETEAALVEARQAEEAGRGEHQQSLGRNINMRQRVARLQRRRDGYQRQLDRVEGQAGYIMVHPGSADVLHGQTRTRGGRRQREHRVGGRLADVQPAIQWESVIVEGQPGLAAQAQQRHRDAQAAQRRRRRGRRRRAR